jgi:nicotinamide-nucleotide amidase
LGTAPGWLVRCPEGKRIVALPGPPRELRRMWLEEAVPRLKFLPAALFRHTFKTQGLGESAVAELLGDLTQSANPSVATYAKTDGVHVRVAAKAASEAEARALAEPVLQRVRQLLDAHIWGSDGDELPVLLQQRLRTRGETVATMESLTGGYVAQLLTSVAGASAVYRGGVVAYSAQAKAAFGVPSDLLERYGSVSEQVAHAMADAARRLFAGDYGLATTGVAGPETSEGKAVGDVYIALSGPRGMVVKQLRLPPLDREWIRERTSYTLLALLWSQLRA